MECLGHHGQLRQLRKGLQSGYDRYGNAHLPSLRYEVKIFLVVVEQLRHRILCPQVLLLLQVPHIHLHIRSLLMLLRIASHAKTKRNTRSFNRCAVEEEPLVEPLHLFDQLRGMRITPFDGRELPVLLGLVATEQ